MKYHMTTAEAVGATYATFKAADDVWSDELARVFGDAACEARYTADGKSTPKLKALATNREAARVAWTNAIDQHKAHVAA